MTNQEWKQVKSEIRDILIKTAKQKSMITYTELVNQVKTFRLEAHDLRLFKLLGEISTTEVSNGKGMISVLVVHKHGDQEPGKGFYELAESLGKDTTNKLKFWSDEFKKVFKDWE